MLEYGPLRFTFNERDFTERCEQAAIKLAFVRERLAVYRDAGVGTLGVTPTAFTAPERLEQLRLLAELAT